MSEITLNLFADLTQKKLVGSDGSAVTLPPLFQGDTINCTLTVLDRATASSTPAPRTDLNIRSLKAAIGPVNTPPVAGQWSVHAPDPNNEGEFLTTGNLAYNAAAADVVTAFNAAFASAGWSAACILSSPSCWLVNLDGVTSSPVTFTAVTNTLSPTTFVRIRSYQDGGSWWYEFRLLQAPAAFNEDGFSQGISDTPTVREVLAGSTGSAGVPPVNEIQSLIVPTNFSGTFFLTWNNYVSGVVSNLSGPSDIENALNEMFTDGSTPFSVTNPVTGQAYIEFTGALGGAPQAEITVTVDQALLGPPEFDLPLDREELAGQLRAANTYTAPLEIQLELVPTSADIDDPDVTGDIVTLCQQPVTIQAVENYNELQAVQTINWLNPPAPRTYVPFSPSQVITGQQNYTTTIGDGESTSIAVVHNLGTDNIASVLVASNTRPGGKILGLGTEYTAAIDSDNQVTLSFAVAPASNSLSVGITTCGPKSAFMAGLTVTIAQVSGLAAALATLTGSVDLLETLVPTGTLVAQASPTATAQTIAIPNAYYLFPNLRLPSTFDPSTLLAAGSNTSAPNTSSLPRPPALLPGFETSSVTTGSSLPGSPSAGEVFQNTGGSAISIPGAGGHRGAQLQPTEYAGYNGSCWYVLDRAGQTNSFFARDYNLQLFPTLEFDRGLWQAGQNFSLSFTLLHQLINARSDNPGNACAAQYMFVLEWGKARSQTSPANTAPNLARVDWFDVPLLSQRLTLTGLQQSRTFGCVISRSTTNKMTATKQLVNAVSVADSCPDTPSFLLRPRLIYFDVPKDAIKPAGYVWAGINAVTASIA
ncbi:MAG TPA: hypothetical protein VGM54_09900 [Chthoniobacter sp.]